jgi:hypothetical protein
MEGERGYFEEEEREEERETLSPCYLLSPTMPRGGEES